MYHRGRALSVTAWWKREMRSGPTSPGSFMAGVLASPVYELLDQPGWEHRGII